MMSEADFQPVLFFRVTPGWARVTQQRNSGDDCGGCLTTSCVHTAVNLTFTATWFDVVWSKHECTEFHVPLLPLLLGKGKGSPYSIPSVGPGADPGVQTVSLQMTVSHPPGGRLPLLYARPAVTSPAAEHHHPLAGTKLYCLVTEAHRCKQLA